MINESEQFGIYDDDVFINGDIQRTYVVPPSATSGGWVLEMEIDANGDLYAIMVDGSDPSIFYYDSTTGNLYYDVT